MHLNTVQVTSLRQDGTAFKCTIPQEGEVWVTIPDNMRGHVEWKATYNIGWTKNPRKTGGFFYNLKQLQVASAAPPAPIPGIVGHNNPPSTNGRTQKDRDIATLAIYKVLLPLRVAHENGPFDNGFCAAVLVDAADIWKRFERAQQTHSVSLEETYE